MPKNIRRLGQDRPATPTLGGVRGPQRLPDPSNNLSLDELLERTEATPTASASEQVQSIPLALIDPSPYQPRLVIEPEQLQALADSIQTSGLLQPILVRPYRGRYELIGGERRWRAHQLLKATHITAYVRELDDASAALGALTDNEAHASLSDYERGKGFQRILSQGLEHSQRALARRIGIHVSTVSRCLAFMELPEPVCQVLDKAPTLIGLRNIKAFVDIGKEQPERLYQAVVKIKDEALSQEAALRWLRQPLQAASESTAKERPQVPGLARLHCQGKRIQLDCESEINTDRLMQVLQEFLSTLPPEDYRR